jgi:hypothetical protein
MRYGDLKPGDILIHERGCWLVVGAKITNVNWVVVRFVRHSGGFIVANGFAVSMALPENLKVIRSELSRSETG